MSRVVKKPASRQAKSSTRRLTKEDGKMSVFSGIRADTGIVIPEVRKVLLDRRKAESAGPVIRRGMYPSEMSQSSWCPLATYLRMSGSPEPASNHSFSLENVFAEGNAIHTKWQNWLSETKILWGDWRCSRCSLYVKDSLKPPGDFEDGCTGTNWVKLSDGLSEAVEGFDHSWKYKEVTLKSTSLPVSGHADGGLVKHDCLVEFKSLSAGGIRYDAPVMAEKHTHEVNGRKILDIDSLWKDFHRPMSSHLKQGNLYLWMAKEMGLPFNRMSFVYEFKSNQQTKEFIVPFSQEIVQPMLDTALIIVKALEDKKPPLCVKGTGGCGECRKYSKEG